MSKDNPVHCLNCGKQLFVITVSKTHVIMKCFACDWKMSIPATTMEKMVQ